MILSAEQKSEGFHAFRMAPAIAKGVLDPFLSISFVRLQQPSMARPQAGYTSIYWVDPKSPSGLVIETGTLGNRNVTPGEAAGIFCGNGVLVRLSPEKEDVHFLELEVKIAMQAEQQSACWADILGDLEEGMYVSEHNPEFFFARASHPPQSWSAEGRTNVCATLTGQHWLREPFVDQQQWFFQGKPLQEPLDRYSSLAMCDRVYNRLVLLSYRRGELGSLSR